MPGKLTKLPSLSMIGYFTLLTGSIKSMEISSSLLREPKEYGLVKYDLSPLVTSISDISMGMPLSSGFGLISHFLWFPTFYVSNLLKILNHCLPLPPQNLQVPVPPQLLQFRVCILSPPQTSSLPEPPQVLQLPDPRQCEQFSLSHSY